LAISIPRPTTGYGGSAFGPDSRRLIALAHKGDRSPRAGRPEVSLREIEEGNVRAVCELEVAPGQEKYVAPSAFTIAEGAYEPNAWVRAIYAGDELAGVLGLVADTETPEYWLARLMIAGQHQQRGVGRAALELLAEHVRTLPGARELLTSCVPGHDGPLGFYLALGFVPTGEVSDGEDVLRLTL
jgi:diamine N-acetyltransferase